MDINLKLTLEDVNGIIAVLATLPFSQVHELIQRVRNQAIEQVQLAQQTQEPEEVKE
jgi:predicted DNA-binding ArsR family transcriptional regulator